MSLSDKIELLRTVVNKHIRNIDGVTKAHIIDKINCVEEDVKEFIKITEEESKAPRVATNNTDWDKGFEMGVNHVIKVMKTNAGDKLL